VGITGIGKVDEPALHHVFMESLLIKALSNSFENNAEHIIVCFDEPWFVAVLLYVINKGKSIVLVVEVDIKTERLLLGGVVEGVAGDQNV